MVPVDIAGTAAHRRSGRAHTHRASSTSTESIMNLMFRTLVCRSVLLGAGVLTVGSCGGSSATTPSTPTPVVQNPLVQFEVADANTTGIFTMSVDGVPTGLSGDRVTFQQRLAPGPHEVAVTSWSNAFSLLVYLGGGSAGNTGGVQPGSVVVNYLASQAPASLVGLPEVTSCGANLSGTPLKTWSTTAGAFVVDFTVALGDVTTVCGFVF
jgi:hypothetical protein